MPPQASATPDPHPTTPPSASPTLARTLGFRDLVAYGLCYIAPVAPLSTLGLVWHASGGSIALAYLLGAVCIAFTASSYVQMSREVPSSGSVYGYARHSLGPLAGFVAGWMLLLDYLLIPALLFVLMSIGMDAVLPGPGRAVWLCLVAAVSLAVNWFGVTVSSRVNQASVWVQLGFVALFLVLCVVALKAGAGTGGLTLRPFAIADGVTLATVISGTAICMLSFLGFDAISTLSEEVDSRDRGLIGRATLAVLVITGGLFVLTAWVLGNLLPAITIKDDATAAFELATAQFSPWVLLVMVIVMVGVAGFTNALPMQVGVSRVLFAMGRDGQLSRVLAAVHPQHRTPHVAMAFASGVSLLLALAFRDRVELLASIVNFGALAAFAFLHLCVVVRLGWRGRSGRTLVHGVVPILGMVIVLAILGGLSPMAKWIGGVWLIIGAVVGVWRNRRGAFAALS